MNALLDEVTVTKHTDKLYEIVPCLDSKTTEYIQRFARTKRQQRVAMIVIQLNNMNGIDYCFNNSTGTEGGYYAYDNTIDQSVVDTDIPPLGQPSLWCNISITDDGKYLYLTKESEHTKDWISYILDNFITPFGYKVKKIM